MERKTDSVGLLEQRNAALAAKMREAQQFECKYGELVDTVNEVKEALSVDEAQDATQMSFAFLLQRQKEETDREQARISELAQALAGKEAELAQSEERHGGQVGKLKEGLNRLLGEKKEMEQAGLPKFKFWEMLMMQQR